MFSSASVDSCLSPGLQRYVELKELMKDPQEETGRWTGCEESPDPRASTSISYLTFKSLVQLRRTMNTGVTLFNCEERTLSDIAERIVAKMINKKEIGAGDGEAVLNTLLQNRSQSDDPESQVLSDGAELQTFSVKDRREGSDRVEASLVLVGSLDFLERPTVAFVRLKDAAALDSATEAPAPVRFVFALVGPSKTDMDYRETGRAMTALLADRVSRLPPSLCRPARPER
ncbi:Band 3 anion exchange protein [Liparis tanakae]|uniref:Band 3 anion exchange protein n=1 Tax=Liparis tanakae TaxID=230148 RepID=A0A4Z2HJ89_9TELE|nr:Band 3 anion exchange protein [Liparis tanakae]